MLNYIMLLKYKDLFLINIPTIFTVLVLIIITNLNNIKFKHFLINFIYLNFIIALTIQLFDILDNTNLVDDSSVVASFFYFEIFSFKIHPFDFIWDKISLCFAITIFIIGFFTNNYTIIYLKDCKRKRNFIKLLNLFIISMLILVLSTDIIMILFAWEGLGITSFFLIGYYSDKPLALKAAYKAFSFNRVSDILFFLFAILFINYTNSSSIYNFMFINSQTTLTLIFLLLMLTSFIKSAQLFFFFWLPDSMEAPIPASALIHSATLVSAGIYLMLRFSYFYTEIFILNQILMYLSIVSAVLFSLVSAFQSDVKKLLAYSTIANCGFMYFLISLGKLELVLFYFMNHGLFKSLSFLLVGNLILRNNHSQDVQKWNINKTNQSLLFMVNLSLFMLSGLNIAIVYDVKHSISLVNLQKNPTMITYLNTLVHFYILNSTLYGTKILIFYTTKNKYVQKYDFDELNATLDKSLVIFFLFNFFLLFHLLLALSPIYMIFNETHTISFIELSMAYVILIASCYYFKHKYHHGKWFGYFYNF